MASGMGVWTYNTSTWEVDTGLPQKVIQGFCEALRKTKLTKPISIHGKTVDVAQ